MFLFSCEDDKIKLSSEATITTLTLTVGSTDYEITFTNTQGKITVPYSTNLSDGAVVKVVTLSAKATGVKAGEKVTISATGIITLRVTAEDKTTTQEYTVTVEKAPASSDASITTLTLTVGSTDHEINFTDRAYTLILPAGSTLPTKVGVKEIALSAGATGVANDDELSVTNNAVTITVTAEDGKTTQEYTVTLSVDASVGASITALTLTVGSTDYEITFQGTRGMVMVPYNTEIPAQVRVKEIALSDGATSVAQGTQLTVTDNAVTITVTAENRTTESAYTVTLSVAANSEASINTLTLTLEDKDYEIMFEDRQGTMTLPYGMAIPAKVGVKNIALSPGATSNTGNGNELSVTDNTVTITVTAEDKTTTQEYTVTVENAGPLSSEAAITSLTLTVGSTDYEITFTGTQDTLLRIGPFGTSIPARVGVKEIKLSSGAMSDATNELEVTDNAVTITVTAEDDKTTQEYTIRLGFTTVGITSFTFEVTDNESMALDTADRKEIVGKIDQEAKTITFAQQSAYVYRDKLKATFEVSEAGAGVQVENENQESGTTEQDFTSPVSYVVRAEGTETTTYRVTLTKSTMATIPDDQFRAKLKEFVPAAFTGDQLDITHNTVINNNGELDVGNQTPKLTSLKGIEFFTALTTLRCYTNSLPSLDVLKNTSLTILSCGRNSLTSLNVSRNASLKELHCFNNSLPSLDVRGNVALTSLQCYNNGLTSLDVRGNVALKVLSCEYNSLASLDVRGNVALTRLSCNDNSLTSLDVRGNVALTSLQCYRNGLTSLDVRKNTALTHLDCNGNSLTSLDMTGMRSVAFAGALRIGTGTGVDNPLETLRVNTALQDHTRIVTMKTNRGADLTITTVNNEGDVVCNDYDPSAVEDKCNQAP